MDAEKMKVKRFEDLECWQESRALTQTIYSYTKQGEFLKDYRLSGQITGASISIMNNISEGFDSRSNNEFVRFLLYARRSCSEVQNCLYIAMDQEYVTRTEFESTYSHCAKVRKMIDGLVRYLKENKRNRQTGITG